MKKKNIDESQMSIDSFLRQSSSMSLKKKKLINDEEDFV